VTGFSAYVLLATSAFTSATLLPGSSEAVLLALLAAKTGSLGVLIVVATVGNVLGSVTNWALGRFFMRFQDRSWFPIEAKATARASVWYNRYGSWMLLFAWVPVIGDPITLLAGAFRVGFLKFLVLVTLSKGLRYLFIVGVFLFSTQAPT